MDGCEMSAESSLDIPPEKIWLQWHGDADGSESGPVAESEVTWCRDKVFDRDVEYVRVNEF